MGRLSRRMCGGGGRRPRVRRGGGSPRNGAGLPRIVSVGPGWIGGALRAGNPLPRWLVSYGSSYHVPVMVREVLHYLRPERGGLYLDGTLGGGGHAAAILEASASARLIAGDRDPEALSEAQRRLAAFGERLRIVGANFSDLIEIAGIEEESLSGALLDLGISSRQVDSEARGFTFRSGAPLDMRMEGEAGLDSAADLLNALAEEELATIFYRYGEERRSRRLARTIVEMRSAAPLTRSEELVAAIDRSIPGATTQDRARIFQALRIAVNQEIEALEAALPALRDRLAPGGVMVVLSYHSLEDRIVKDAFREWSRECVCPVGLPVCVCRGRPLGTLLTRKPVMASQEEVASNSRSRSARLRAWRKT